MELKIIFKVKSCKECPCKNSEFYTCNLHDENYSVVDVIDGEFPDFCPLFYADFLIKKISNQEK